MVDIIGKFLHSFIAEPLIDLFFPPVCFVCDTLLSPQENIVCRKCFASLDRFISETTEFSDGKFLFRNLIILFEYSAGIRQMIHLFKYQNCRGMAKHFAQEAILRLQSTRISGYHMIIPVPLHKQRLRERGYNQSEEIARCMAMKLAIPYQTDILIRLRNTATQTRFNKQERIQNVHQAFSCSSDVSGLQIILIDDVITTGSTVNECCAALLSAGAEAVDVLALANPRLDQ